MKLKTYRPKQSIVMAFQWVASDNPPPAEPGPHATNPYVAWEKIGVVGPPYPHVRPSDETVIVIDKYGGGYSSVVLDDGDWVVIGDDSIQIMDAADFKERYEEASA